MSSPVTFVTLAPANQMDFCTIGMVSVNSVTYNLGYVYRYTDRATEPNISTIPLYCVKFQID